MGFTGFKDFKRSVVSKLSTSASLSKVSPVGGFEDIRNRHSKEGIARYIAQNSIVSIEDTYKLLDLDKVAEIAKIISNARMVIIFGVGASGIVAEDFCYKLMRIGINVTSYKDFHINLTAATMLTENDVAIFISHSGQTKEIIELADIANEMNAETIGITRYGKNLLGLKCNSILYTSTPEVEKRSGAMGSRIAQLYIIDVLFTIIANRNYNTIHEKLEQSYKRSLPHKK